MCVIFCFAFYFPLNYRIMNYCENHLNSPSRCCCPFQTLREKLTPDYLICRALLRKAISSLLLNCQRHQRGFPDSPVKQETILFWVMPVCTSIGHDYNSNLLHTSLRRRTRFHISHVSYHPLSLRSVQTILYLHLAQFIYQQDKHTLKFTPKWTLPWFTVFLMQMWSDLKSLNQCVIVCLQSSSGLALYSLLEPFPDITKAEPVLKHCCSMNLWAFTCHWTIPWNYFCS